MDFKRKKLEEQWEGLYSLHSSRLTLIGTDGIHYRDLAYAVDRESDAMDRTDAVRSENAIWDQTGNAGVSFWWQEYLRQKKDFCGQYSGWLKAGSSEITWEDCLASCPGNHGDGSANHHTHLIFAEFLWKRLCKARHSVLFREAVAQIDPALTLISRKNILKPTRWRDHVSQIDDSDSGAHYDSSSYSRWAYSEADVIPPRDVIVQMCLQWGISAAQTNHILRAAGYAALYPNDPVDFIALYEADRGDRNEDAVARLRRTKNEINSFLRERTVADSSLQRALQQTLGGQFENVCPAGDYGLHDSLQQYLDHPERYRRNLVYSHFDERTHRTWPIERLEGGTKVLVPAGLDLRLLVKSLMKADSGNSVKESTRISAVNTIMSLNDLICPQEMFDLIPFDANGHRLPGGRKSYVNAKMTSTNSSAVRRILDQNKGLTVTKLDLIRYMIATGQEDDLGENLKESGFWEANYIHEEEAIREDELDITDYVVIYALRYRNRLLGSRTLVTSSLYEEFSIIQLLMEICRNSELLCSVMAELARQGAPARLTGIQNTGRNKKVNVIKEVVNDYQMIRAYFPYPVTLPRYKSGNIRENPEDGQRDLDRMNPVPPSVYCCSWIADFELIYDWQPERRREEQIHD